MNYVLIIKQLRKKMMVSQIELSQIIGVSFQSINRWENGKTTPVYAARRKIAELCKKYKIKMEEKHD